MSDPTLAPRARARSFPGRSRLTALVAAAASVACIVVPLSQAAGAPAASAATPSCNGNPLGAGGTWKCTFDDEFNGTSLNTANWQPQLTATSGYITGGDDCYVDNAQTISVSGGYLDLSARKVAPFSCVPGYTSSYEAGMVTSSDLFDQTYGFYEVRAKVPGATVAGLQETLWLYPQATPTPGNTGEIDFAEFYSQYPTLDIPYLHYKYASQDPDVTSYNCTINANAFNTYGVDWTSSTITVYLNGNVCLVDHPIDGPAPFNVAHFIALTKALGTGSNAFTSSTPLPATTQVDYVRAWAAG